MLNKGMPFFKQGVYGLSAVATIALTMLPGLADVTFKQALPGYQFQFPRDHASHPAYKTEWWYYTGHLKSPSGRTFGYELTFFRVGTGLESLGKSPWSMDQLYLAHFAVTDDKNQRFFHTEQLSRAGLHWAGADTSRYRVWNKDWSTQQLNAVVGQEKFHLKAANPRSGIALDLTLKSEKPPVLHGKNGVSQKADCVGCASHYYSMTRLATTGTLSIGGQSLPVTGATWMDHEFGSNQMTREQVGWDWFSVQLDNETELMLYQLRRKAGTPDPNSSGSFIPALTTKLPKANKAAIVDHLTLNQFSIVPLRSWTSPVTKGKYPSGWRVSVPSKGLELTITPTVKGQELASQKSGTQSGNIAYWEGRCKVEGTQNGKPVKGQAYVELTGYAGAFKQKI